MRYSDWWTLSAAGGEWLFKKRAMQLETFRTDLSVHEAYKYDASVYNREAPFALLAYPNGGMGLRVDDDGYLKVTCPRCREEIEAHEWFGGSVTRLVSLLRCNPLTCICPCCNGVSVGEELWSDMRMFTESGDNHTGRLRRKTVIFVSVNWVAYGEYAGAGAAITFSRHDGEDTRVLDRPVTITGVHMLDDGFMVEGFDIGGIGVGEPRITRLSGPPTGPERSIWLEGWWPVEEGVRTGASQG